MVPEIDSDPTHMLDQTITLVGTARDGAAGAAVMLSDGTPVYVKGLTSWDDAWDRKRIRITGMLRDRKIGGDPDVNAKGEVSHGMEGDSLVLEDATWEAAT
ncbi:MAG: hypothetical protein EXR72_24260 [Myxococcales bacterium]|nr:hypothetical protein [Myxococcales bacterium]